MPYDMRFVSTYFPRKCGIGTYTRNLVTALGNFTSEVASRDVAAIINRDEIPETYSSPVDLTINQHDSQSWRDNAEYIIERAKQRGGQPVASLQFEFGIGGENFVDMAKTLKENGFIVMSYLHTILRDPEEPMFPEAVRITRELADNSDTLVVHTKRGVKTLISPLYGIDKSKIKQIDHGIRLLEPSEHDRQEIKGKYGIGRILVTTLGMLSPNKGIEYGIRAYSEFIKESCSDNQRRDITYLVAGGYHPDFIAHNEGRNWKEYRAMLDGTLEETGLRCCTKPRFTDILELNLEDYDIVLVEEFLDEKNLVEMYAATNMMVLPYLNMQQAISGVMSDTIGSRRLAIATKFDHALEALNPQDPDGEGILGIGEPDATGILVDPGEESIMQIAKALDYLIINETGQRERESYEKNAHELGHQMSWDNAAWGLIDYARYIEHRKQIVTEDDAKFTREKPSRFAKEPYNP